MAKSKTCGQCGATGHNKRTCVKGPPVEQVVEKSSKGVTGKAATTPEELPDDLPPFDPDGPNVGDIVSIQVNDNDEIKRCNALVVEVNPEAVCNIHLKFSHLAELYWVPQITVDLESKADRS